MAGSNKIFIGMLIIPISPFVKRTILDSSKTFSEFYSLTRDYNFPVLLEFALKKCMLSLSSPENKIWVLHFCSLLVGNTCLSLVWA